MIRIIICGAKGRMGAKVKEILCSGDARAVCGVDIKEDFSDRQFPVYASFSGVKEKADVVIDFSSPKSLAGVYDYCVKTATPVVLCSTGYSEEDLKKIDELSAKVAVFRSANMSLGVNVLINAVKSAAKTLYGFDVEIIEKHHNKKKDAPSGTAVMLSDAIKSVYPEKTEVYGRHGLVGERNKDEIGIHSVRGGSIVGEHQVIFAGNDEILTFSHEALSRNVFAEGAVKAAKFIFGKPAGLYDMEDLLNS